MVEPEFLNGGLGRHFTIVLSKALRDSRLSWRAKGILAGCLSHAENFTFNRSWIIAHGTEGRDAVIAALKELRDLGYLENVKTRDDAGRVTGEHYRFTDRPSKPTPDQAPEPSEPLAKDRRPENQRPEKPDAGKPGRLRRSISSRSIQEKNPPISPQAKAKRFTEPIELPEWAEPYRHHLTEWLAKRLAKHKLKPEITKNTISALEYAKSLGVLAQYCEYASERQWQSLGFAGHKELIEKLAKDNGTLKTDKHSRPAMQEIVYTLK